MHLNDPALAQLFGKDYDLQILRAISQPEQFAFQETVNLIGPQNHLEKVRVLGPFRNAT